jgi:hypothetical protein
MGIREGCLESGRGASVGGEFAANRADAVLEAALRFRTGVGGPAEPTRGGRAADAGRFGPAGNPMVSGWRGARRGVRCMGSRVIGDKGA